MLVANSCEDSSSIVWDWINFTKATNKQIYDQVIDGEFVNPLVQLKMTCNHDSIKFQNATK